MGESKPISSEHDSEELIPDPTASLPDFAKPGAVFAGKYRVEYVLGTGAMGVVVAATHLQLDELVAIKMLLPDTLGNRDAVMRFDREARASVKIKSEHVARTIDVDKLANGAPYMVMEFLRGTDLQERLAQAGRLEIPSAVDKLLQACEAVAEAHSLGIVHRDLKPANLFLTRRPDHTESVKVLDFGISKSTNMTRTGELKLTQDTAMLGSPMYMSPEQISSAKEVDARSDIWAMGVILFEMLTGDLPFDEETLPRLCIAIVHESPTSIRERRPEVPVELEQVINRCLEKSPSDRFQSVAELAIALAPFGSRKAQLSVDRVSRVLAPAGVYSTDRPPAGAGGGPFQETTQTLVSWAQSQNGRRPSPLLLSAIAVLVLLVFGLGFALTGSDKSDKSASEQNDQAAKAAVAPPAASAVPPAEPVAEPEPEPAVAPVASEAQPEPEPEPQAAAKPAPTPAPRVTAKRSVRPKKRTTVRIDTTKKTKPAAETADPYSFRK